MYALQPERIREFPLSDDRLQLESNFSTLNPKVHVSPTQLAWTPFKMPAEGSSVDFVDGIKTCAGSGEPTLKDGLAVHVCAFANSIAIQVLTLFDRRHVQRLDDTQGVLQQRRAHAHCPRTRSPRRPNRAWESHGEQRRDLRDPEGPALPRLAA